MLNNYASNNTNINNTMQINAVSGNILKNYKKSFFKRFKLDSDMARTLFDDDMPHLTKYKTTYNNNDYRGYTQEIKKPVVIIQMMMCGNSEVLAEIMWQDEFDGMFNDN